MSGKVREVAINKESVELYKILKFENRVASGGDYAQGVR